jgi:hypothetical protein
MATMIVRLLEAETYNIFALAYKLENDYLERNKDSDCFFILCFFSCFFLAWGQFCGFGFFFLIM